MPFEGETNPMLLGQGQTSFSEQQVMHEEDGQAIRRRRCCCSLALALAALSRSSLTEDSLFEFEQLDAGDDTLEDILVCRKLCYETASRGSKEGAHLTASRQRASMRFTSPGDEALRFAREATLPWWAETPSRTRPARRYKSMVVVGDHQMGLAFGIVTVNRGIVHCAKDCPCHPQRCQLGQVPPSRPVEVNQPC
jgi:hypothetical protein